MQGAKQAGMQAGKTPFTQLRPSLHESSIFIVLVVSILVGQSVVADSSSAKASAPFPDPTSQAPPSQASPSSAQPEIMLKPNEKSFSGIPRLVRGNPVSEVFFINLPSFVIPMNDSHNRIFQRFQEAAQKRTPVDFVADEKNRVVLRLKGDRPKVTVAESEEFDEPRSRNKTGGPEGSGSEGKSKSEKQMGR